VTAFGALIVTATKGQRKVAVIFFVFSLLIYKLFIGIYPGNKNRIK